MGKENDGYTGYLLRISDEQIELSNMQDILAELGKKREEEAREKQGNNLYSVYQKLNKKPNNPP